MTLPEQLEKDRQQAILDQSRNAQTLQKEAFVTNVFSSGTISKNSNLYVYVAIAVAFGLLIYSKYGK